MCSGGKFYVNSISRNLLWDSLWDLHGISIALTIRSLDPSLSESLSRSLFTRLMDFCDCLDCMWHVAGDESARSLS